MKYRRRTTLTLIAATIAVIGLLVNCRNQTESPEAAQSDSPAAEKPSAVDDSESTPPYYSAFGVKVRHNEHFDLISFKDVGLDRSDPKPNGPFLEALAQALAYRFDTHDSLAADARLVYNESLADPEEHTYCEKDRLYVDLWHSSAPSRFGFSLWSGCSNNQRFEKTEMPGPSIDKAPPENVVEPIAKEIVDSVQSAERRDCYKKAC